MEVAMMDFEPGQFANEYASPNGQKLWKILTRPDVVARMETASDLGHPALAAVEDILLGELGEVILQDRYKQMAGRMTKQILEAHGFVHVASDVRLNSVPFYKASRYRRRDETGLYLFRNSSDPREICLVGSRKGEKMPPPKVGRWLYVNYISSPLKASVGYGLDLKRAVLAVEQQGYLCQYAPRTTRRP
jgi:hypothetical protein